jgi:hypothetical protein
MLQSKLDLPCAIIVMSLVCMLMWWLWSLDPAWTRFHGWLTTGRLQQHTQLVMTHPFMAWCTTEGYLPPRATLWPACCTALMS